MRKSTRPRRLKEGDFFFEVILRAGVRKEELPAVLAVAEKREDDETDEERLLSAILDIAEQAFDTNNKVEFTSASAGTIDTFKEFDNFRRMGGFARRFRRKNKPEIESPLNTKKNKGKKISLETADRLFTGFKERLSRVTSYEEFGVDVALVLLFGSYFRREPQLGDIDVAVLTIPRANYDNRVNELRQAGKSRNLIEELYGPQFEVIKFLKNRSQWFAVHEVDELRQMKDVRFAVVHYTPLFQNVLSLFEKNRLTGEQFLIRCEQLRKANWTEERKGSEISQNEEI